MPDYILSLLIFLPTASAFLVLFFRRNSSIVWLSAVTSAITTAISVILFLGFQNDDSGFQFVHWIPDWIVSGRLSIDYMVGLDGFGLLLILLSTFTFFVSTLASFKNIGKRVKEFHFCLLVLQTAVLGIFSSLNLVLFYIFWELMVIPMALMVGVWGGENRVRAAIKYLMFSMGGSLLMLAGILILYFQTGSTSMEVLSVTSISTISPGIRLLLFLSFALAFCIKIPVFPMHTWMPELHSEAPTVGSVDMAAVLLKLGIFGFIRILIPFFPDLSLDYREVFSGLALVGILWGAFAAYSQKDSKRLVAYSSLSHLGFTLLGVMSFTYLGVMGGMLQVVSHGISTGMIFLLLGMYSDRTGKRNLSEMGGVAAEMPVFSVFFLIAVLSSVGLPGTNGFIGEFLILLGALKADWLLGSIAATGVVWASIYLLWFTKSFLFGPPKSLTNAPKMKDLEFREYVILVPMVLLIFWIGLAPNTFLTKLESSVSVFLNSASISQIESRKKPGREGTGDYRSLGKFPESYEDRIGFYATGRELLRFSSIPIGDRLKNQEMNREKEEGKIYGLPNGEESLKIPDEKKMDESLGEEK
jgi:NADH-quinone oxidoreductase subunit M